MPARLKKRRKLYLVHVKLGPRITDIKWNDLLDEVLLMIIKNLHIKIAYQVQVYLISVIPDSHYEHTILVQHPYLFVERE